MCRICCNIVGKKINEVKKYTDSIENHFVVNINLDDNALYPEYICQKCYVLITSSRKWKTIIKLKPYYGRDPHSSN